MTLLTGEQPYLRDIMFKHVLRMITGNDCELVLMVCLAADTASELTTISLKDRQGSHTSHWHQQTLTPTLSGFQFTWEVILGLQFTVEDSKWPRHVLEIFSCDMARELSSWHIPPWDYMQHHVDWYTSASFFFIGLLHIPVESKHQKFGGVFTET